MKKRLLLFSLFFVLVGRFAAAQTDTMVYQLPTIQFLDSLVVKAKGFDTDDFIRMVQTDSSFAQAFRNLRFFPHQCDGDIAFFDKKRHSKASFSSKTKQTMRGNCRKMSFIAQQVTGDYYEDIKTKALRYYTAQLYHRLFFTEGEVCASRYGKAAVPTNAVEKHILHLKTLIFNPGKHIDIPFIGDKTSIFEPQMQKYYAYEIASDTFNRRRVWVFRVKVKPQYMERKQGKTVVKRMETYFEKSSKQVLARNYTLSYQGFAFDFDVEMRIRLTQKNEAYLPSYIEYKGFWNVLLQKPERAEFKLNFDFD